MENYPLTRKILLILFMFAGFAALPADNDSEDEAVLIRYSAPCELIHVIKNCRESANSALKVNCCINAQCPETKISAKSQTDNSKGFSPPLLV